MRSDMHKVIVEEGRGGAGYEKKKGRLANTPLDLLPLKQGMRRPYERQKWFGEHLGPLKRWLRSKVGRPWNEVYSEACSVIKPDSVVRAHIKTHLLQMVERYTFLRGQEIWLYQRSREIPLSELSTHSCWPTFYVHPGTGLFCESLYRQSHKRKMHPENLEEKWITKAKLLKKLNGCWFELHFRPRGPYDPEAVFDYQQKRWLRASAGAKYCFFKRQLSRKEVRRYFA